MAVHSKETWDGSRDFRADGQRGGSRRRETGSAGGQGEGEDNDGEDEGEERSERGGGERERFAGTAGKGGLLS